MSARLLFIALWNYADDEGRMQWDARLIRAFAFPLDDISIQDLLGWMDELVKVRLIVPYTANGLSNGYAYIRSWTEHQTINRPTPSRLPQPPDNLPMEMNAHGTLTEDSVSPQAEVKLREVKEKEKGDTHGKFTESTEPPTSPSEPSPYPNPPSWDKNALTSPLGGKNGHPEKTPRDVNAVREYAATISATDEEADSFFDHFASNGWKVSGRTPMRDWQAAFRNWHRRNPKIPTADEARTELVEKRGWAEQDAVAFYAHYSASGWRDKNGNPITNWLAKAKTWQRNSSR